MKSRWLRNASFLCALLFLTSCTQANGETESRYTKSSDISSASSAQETAVESSSTEETTEEATTEETTETSAWGGSIKPSSFGFNLQFKENMVVADYGHDSVSVYHAKYGQVMPHLLDEETWHLDGMNTVRDWCVGYPFILFQQAKGDMYVNQYQILSRDKILENLYNVQVVALSQIQNSEEFIELYDVDPNSEILMWTYQIHDFPWEAAQKSEYFQVPSDISSLDYSRLCIQYVDDIPLYGTVSRPKEKTLSWKGVIDEARFPDMYANGRYSGAMITNPGHTCVVEYESQRYEVLEAFLTDQIIIDPYSCMDGIGKALKYDPMAVTMGSADPSKEPLSDIWGKDIVVYCMELSYAVLDPTPRLEPGDPEFEKKHAETELTLVPVWEVYYTVTDPDNDSIVGNGMVMVNAVTGESLFSDEYGYQKNEKLFPHLHDPG